MDCREDRDTDCDALRDRLWAGRQANYESLDKYILTLSSGGLALSITFVKDVVPLSLSVWCPVLIASWFFFVAAIVSTLLSFIVSHRAHDRQLENLEKYRAGEKNALQDENNHFRTWTERLNWVSAFSFFVGLLVTLIFVAVNVYQVKEMSNKNKLDVPTEKKAIVPPNLPVPPQRPATPQPVSQPAPSKEK